jgi:hypothetical protein
MQWFYYRDFRQSGKIPVCSEWFQMSLNGRLIRDEKAFKILLVISSFPDEFFHLRVHIVLSISISVVEMIFILGNPSGNASFNSESAYSPPS